MPSTPGPWDQEYVVAGENRGALIIKSVAGQVHVATIEDDGGVPGADEANGKLIAEAPEMLKALELAEASLRLISNDMLSGIEFDATHAKHARRDADQLAAVIKRARGA